ncbi:MAG: hypothetical protein DRJ10_08670 [Bacteroidetes bacterium]|nr:MAG: hypothetical protein DRI89_02040 [Bacteroidota bacterium]RLD79562.1 MAG: hypothetical protein DRJ10_08670 [Bacteroidota bacterium]
MSQYIFEKGYKNDSRLVKVKLLLIHFEDENNIQFIYSPHLDLTGYGDSLSNAKDSFEIALEDFVDYTLKKKTIGKVLTELGWETKGSRKKPKKILAPSITSVINDNEYVSEIFDKYSTNTYHQEVGIPALA